MPSLQSPIPCIGNDRTEGTSERPVAKRPHRPFGDHHLAGLAGWREPEAHLLMQKQLHFYLQYCCFLGFEQMENWNSAIPIHSCRLWPLVFEAAKPMSKKFAILDP
jgi:hypothetical protein